jgi:hypothetical protein
MALDLVEGWTEPIRYQLTADGAVDDYTNMTVALVAHDKHGTALALAGSVNWSDATTGIVVYSPDAADLLRINSPMRIRWRVTDTDDKVAYFPNSEPEEWTIRSA